MKKKNIKVVAYWIFLILCILYLGNKITYTAYRTNIDLESNINPRATWSILINDTNITEASSDFIKIDEIVWTSPDHVVDNKLAVGSTGVMKLEIDASAAEVAVIYNLKFIDKNVNSDKYLTITNITAEGNELTKIDDGEYSGIFLLNDVNRKVNIIVNLEWVDDGDFEYITDEDLDDTSNYFEILFEAKQYRGE